MGSSAGAGPLAVLVDGVPGVGLPVTDRGLAYGDGLFETLLIRDGTPCQWSRHLRRLDLGARRLGMEPLDARALTEQGRQFIPANLDVLTHGRAVLKILLTRGDGGRGYRADPRGNPRLILALYPAPRHPAAWYTEGVRVRLCDTPASVNPRLAGLKHLNRLDNVLARSEWLEADIGEGLMATPDGDIIGGTMSNLFLWDGARLLTPGLSAAGIAGTVRELALEQAARGGLSVLETRVSAGDVARAPAAFLTNSVIGVWPVAELAGRRLDPALLPQPFLADLRAAAHQPEDPWP